MTVFDLDIPAFEFAAVFQISFTTAVFEVARLKWQRTFKCTEYRTIGVSFPILTDITRGVYNMRNHQVSEQIIYQGKNYHKLLTNIYFDTCFITNF